MYSILQSEILRFRLRMTRFCFNLPREKLLSDSCYHSFTAERSSHSYSVVAVENHPLENSASDTVLGSLTISKGAVKKVCHSEPLLGEESPNVRKMLKHKAFRTEIL